MCGSEQPPFRRILGALELPPRFWHQVVLDVTGCWFWTGFTDEEGYGRFGHSRTSRLTAFVHKLVYLYVEGPIEASQQIDHICHDADICSAARRCPHRRCVNPGHLQATTPQVNVHRSGGPAALNLLKIECPQGHLYDDENTMYEGRKRRCRTCRSEQLRRAQDKRRMRLMALAPP